MGFRLKDERYIYRMVQFYKRDGNKVITDLLKESKRCVRCDQPYELTPRGLIDNFGGIAEVFIDEKIVILYPICKDCNKEYKRYKYWKHDDEKEKSIRKHIAKRVKN